MKKVVAKEIYPLTEGSAVFMCIRVVSDGLTLTPEEVQRLAQTYLELNRTYCGPAAALAEGANQRIRDAGAKLALHLRQHAEASNDESERAACAAWDEALKAATT